MAKKSKQKSVSLAMLVRFRDEEQSQLVRNAAKRLDMSLTAFVRSAAEAKALAFEKEQSAQDQ